MNDVYQFDISAGQWANLSNVVKGDRPAPRASFGFASVGGRLYLFGGLNWNGKLWA